MHAFLTRPEVRGGGAPTDEVDVDVPSGRVNVPQESPVAIRVVEAWIRLELDPTSRAREPLELASCLKRVTLSPSELGRVDLQEPDAGSRAYIEGVAVADSRDDRARALPLGRKLRAAAERGDEREGEGAR
jgi:hypothetical protein